MGMIANLIARYTGKKDLSTNPVFVASGLRQGMWVVDKAGRIAIVNAATGTDIVEVHYVDDETGETVVAAQVQASNLMQAPYNSIPRDRRPLKEVAKKFGYKV